MAVTSPITLTRYGMEEALRLLRIRDAREIVTIVKGGVTHHNMVLASLVIGSERKPKVTATFRQVVTTQR